MRLQAAVKVKFNGKSLAVTKQHQERGQDAKRQKEDEGKNPPSWAVDEDIWDRAKAAADKTYDESDDAYWPVVVTIYENMGGSVGAIDSAPDGTVQAREWSTAFVNDLPDSSFLYVESGGKKDDEGKTVPRSLRHFPYKDSSGAVDLPHLRNALARIPQSNAPESAKKAATAKAEKLLESENKKSAKASAPGAVGAAGVGAVQAQGTSDGNRKAWETRKALSYTEKSESAEAHSSLATKATERADEEDTEDSHRAAAMAHLNAMDKHGVAHDYAALEKRDFHLEQSSNHEAAMKDHLRKADKARKRVVDAQEYEMEARKREQADVVHSRSSSADLGTDPPKQFMWMPGGISTIEATWNGKPIRMTVECDESTADTVTASLERWRERYPKQKPFICVEHREEEAAGWPDSFEWRDDPEPGVFCSTESWSDLGNRNITGRIHRSFSPSFATDADYSRAREDAEGVLSFPDGVRGSESNPARVTGVAFSIGSLTNKPAFRNILPVRAKQADPQPGTNPPNAETRKMKIKFTRARGTNAAGAVAELPEAEAVKAIQDGDALDFRAAEAIEASDKAKDEAKKEIRKMHEKMIDDAIKAGRERKAIEPQNEEVRAKAIKWLDASGDVDMVTEFINALPAKVPTANLTARTTSSDGGVGGASTVSGIQLQKPGLDEACQAYVRCRAPMDGLLRAGKFKEAFELSHESSAIFSAHVRPVIASGGDFRMKDVIRAADVTDGNLGTLATGLILMRNLGYLKNKLVWLPYVSTDLRNEPATYGQPVFTRYITPPAVTTFNTSTGWSNSTATTTDKTVTLNNHEGVQISFNTQLLGSTMRNLFAEQQGAQFYSLANSINTSFIATLLAATWTPTLADDTTAVGSYVKGLGDWDIKSLVGVKNKLTLARIPDVGRFVLLHSTYHDKLLEDSNLVLARTIQSALNRGESDALTEGTLPTLFGIKPLESQLMTDDLAYDGDTHGAPTKVGFAGNMSCMLFVARIPQDYTAVFPNVPSTAAIEIITEPDSGLSMLFVRYVNHQLATATARCSLMYGSAQGHPKMGFFIKPS